MDHLWNRLFRSMQDRKARMDMINQLYRKRGQKKYRFSESRMRDRISIMFGDKVQATPARKDSLIDESIELRSPSKTSPKASPKTDW